MRAGYLLMLAGVWVACQVLGGNALQRLKLLPSSTQPHESIQAPGAPNLTVPPGMVQ